MKFVVFLIFLFRFRIVVASETNASCSPINLQHGRVISLGPWEKAILECNKPYVLIGEEVVVCINGIWTSNFHICARKDCPRLSKIMHGSLLLNSQKSLATVICDQNYKLIGSSVLYCNSRRRWNDTLPECMANDMERFKPCHFELTDPRHCRWLLNPSSMYKWTIYSPYHDELEDEEADYSPIDHTLEQSDGHYLLLVKRALKHGRTSKHSTKEAKFISPLLPATAVLNETLCLVFYSFINSLHSGFLKVLINDLSVWQSNHKETDYKKWTRHIIDLSNQDQPFRISLAAVPMAPEDAPGIAVDDLLLLRGDECDFNVNTMSTIISETENPTTRISSTKKADRMKLTSSTEFMTWSPFIQSTILTQTTNTEADSVSPTFEISTQIEGTDVTSLAPFLTPSSGTTTKAPSENEPTSEYKFNEYNEYDGDDYDYDYDDYDESSENEEHAQPYPKVLVAADVVHDGVPAIRLNEAQSGVTGMSESHREHDDTTFLNSSKSFCFVVLLMVAGAVLLFIVFARYRIRDLFRHKSLAEGCEYFFSKTNLRVPSRDDSVSLRLVDVQM